MTSPTLEELEAERDRLWEVFFATATAADAARAVADAAYDAYAAAAIAARRSSK